MSWSGSVAGAASYPSQPYTNGQPSYGQHQPYQYGHQPAYGQYPPGPTFPAPGPPQRPPNIQPPKKKGNPIITRYPPPPGYRGPAQPQTPFGANQYPNQYQPPQPGYSQAAAASSVYPNQGYAAPPTSQGYPPQGFGPPHPPAYSQQPYPQSQNYQWPQQGYPPKQSYPQAPGHLNGHGLTPSTSHYPSHQLQSAPVDPSAQPYGQALGWPASNGHAAYSSNYQNASHNAPPHNTSQGFDPNATPTPATAHLVATQPSQTASQPSSAVEESSSGAKPQLFLAWDDWDFDFEGAIWPKSNEPVDPNLSLGVILWHPAKQVTRALPSTFDEAEEQALKPTPEKLDNGESVSMYFMAENSHEAFLDVRQTDEWDSIRDDPIFVVFTDEDMGQNLVSLEDCIAQRDRSDEPIVNTQKDDDEEMPDVSWNVMDHLEQELSSTSGALGSKTIEHQHSSVTGSSQEDILAKLGVTGAPKPPSDGPLPQSFPSFEDPPVSLHERPAAVSSLPPDTQPPLHRAHSYGGHRDTNTRAIQRPYGSVSSGAFCRPRVPPPPPPPEPQRYGSWNQLQYGNQDRDVARGSPARSEGSNHTMAGSDFEPDKLNSSTENENPTIPALTRSDSSFSRKRSYEEDIDHGDEKSGQQDDHTKRKRRSQVDAAYSRR